MEGHNKQLGAYGERLAEQFFLRRGYRTLTKNFQTANGEIDLIIRKADEILFIEVKTRTSNAFGYPETAVNHEKIKHLSAAIESYLQQHKIKSFWRLDIASVEINKQKKTAKITWFKGIG